MRDTGQPIAAPASEVATTEDQLRAAAAAFRGYEPSPARDASPGGEAVPPDAGEADAVEAADEPEPGEAGAERRDADAEEEEAPDDGQPDPSPLPESWPSDKAALWAELPPEAQAYIRERDGQMKAAIGARFEEAARLKKAAEEKAAAEIGEAQASRLHYAEAVEQVLALVQPRRPPVSMLDRHSADYDPDLYHVLERRHEETSAFLQQHKTQLDRLRAQESLQRFHALNDATRDAFIAEVPEIADQHKAPAIFDDLIGYAVSRGIPVATFDEPTSAVEWNLLWKARQYDRLQEAKAKVRSDPKPEPRKPQPAVRPGVTVPRSAIEQAGRKKAMDRLKTEGSVDAGAAALKHLLKGNLS